MKVVRLALGLSAVAVAWYTAIKTVAYFEGAPWRVLIPGLPVAAAFGYLLGQFQQVLHDPYREPLPLEEPSVLNSGPATPAFLVISLVVLLIFAGHSAAPELVDMDRALAALLGASLIAQGRSHQPWVLEMNESARPHRWFGAKAHRRGLVILGAFVIALALFAPREWVSKFLDAQSRSRRRDRAAIQQEVLPDSG